MEFLPSDCLTPFTDFRVEDRGGLPRAVFDRLPPEQGSLLSRFLHPDRAYIGALYLDVLKVAKKEISWITYKDDYFEVTFGPRRVVIETREPSRQGGSRVRLRLPLGDVMLLLMRWGIRCVTWGRHSGAETPAMRHAPSPRRVPAPESSFEKGERESPRMNTSTAVS